jgi:hypothetical protein
MITPKQLFNICLYFALLIFIGIGIYGGWLATRSLWPGIHEDGSLYSTVIINRSNGLGNTFSVHINQNHLESKIVECAHYSNLDHHGQLYYPLIASLMQGNDYSALLKVIHFSNLIAFIVSIWLFYLLMRRVWNLPEIMSLASGTGMAYAVVGILHYLQGRPEHGSVIVIVIFGLLRELFFPKQVPFWLSGILIGILIGISPLSGGYYALLYTLSKSISAKSNKSLTLNMTTCIVTIIATWASLTSIVYSESLWSLILNTFISGGNTNRGSFINLPSFPFFSITPFINYWIINPYAPFAVFSYLVTCLVLLVLLLQKWSNRPVVLSLIVSISVIVIIFPQFWYNFFFASALNYNILCLYPAMAIWLFDRFAFLSRIQVFQINIKQDDLDEWKTIGLFKSVFFKKFIPILIVIVISLPGTGYLRNSLMQWTILSNGVSYEKAKKHYQILKSQLADDEVVIITRYSGSQSRSAVVFDEPPWKMITDNYWDESLDKIEDICRIKAKFLLIMQGRDPFPPKIPGFHLIEDAFNRRPVKFLGKLIRVTTPGYGYAAYLRIHQE